MNLDKATEARWWKALKDSNTEVVKNILKNFNVDVNAHGKWGSTPLHLVDNKKLVHLLIEKGAYVDAKDEFGRTPLHNFSSWSRELTKVLIEAEADVNAKDGYK